MTSTRNIRGIWFMKKIEIETILVKNVGGSM